MLKGTRGNTQRKCRKEMPEGNAWRKCPEGKAQRKCPEEMPRGNTGMCLKEISGGARRKCLKEMPKGARSFFSFSSGHVPACPEEN